ncbi:hypothetical protein PTTG_27045 [Puccinia triticina 1-1 BBBD Race 1]|uniref:Uncharacterized protein n=1 Tax=Puccinia triticina (isolate 1-1 / race 1 (BBBD)) TaxID=630390 RepID=A0A180GNR6_PUCT1|nr:hypothetical protein PTTG_27045 [Puccinia triticina 1-1 BBBD Race 1]
MSASHRQYLDELVRRIYRSPPIAAAAPPPAAVSAASARSLLRPVPGHKDLAMLLARHGSFDVTIEFVRVAAVQLDALIESLSQEDAVHAPIDRLCLAEPACKTVTEWLSQVNPVELVLTFIISAIIKLTLHGWQRAFFPNQRRVRGPAERGRKLIPKDAVLLHPSATCQISSSGPPGPVKGSSQPSSGETILSLIDPADTPNNVPTQATNDHERMIASPVQTGREQTTVTTSLFTWAGLM